MDSGIAENGKVRHAIDLVGVQLRQQMIQQTPINFNASPGSLMFFRVSNERRMFNLCWNDFIPLGLGNGQRDTVPLQAREDGRRRKKIGTPCWIDITNSAVEILLNHA